MCWRRSKKPRRTASLLFRLTAVTGKLSDVEQHHAQGGKLKVIALIKESQRKPSRACIPIAVAHHGEATDAAWKNAENRGCPRVHQTRASDRRTGGVSTHKPEVIEYIEEHDWDVNFFMGCVYNRTRTPDEIKTLLNGELPLPPNEVYLEKDPQRMFAAMRKTKKTCFAFKILAAGRMAKSSNEVNAAFRTAFAGIKPNDCIIVGHYPRFKNEIQENAERVRAILGKT